MKFADIYGNSIANEFDGYPHDPFPTRWEIYGEDGDDYLIRRRVLGFLWRIERRIKKDSPMIVKIFEK